MEVVFAFLFYKSFIFGCAGSSLLRGLSSSCGEGGLLTVKIKQHFHILLIYFIHRKFIISFVWEKKKNPEDSESQKHLDNYFLVVMCRLLIVVPSLIADLGLLGMQASVVAELWFLGSRAQAQQL